MKSFSEGGAALERVVVFQLDDQRYALMLHAVDGVLPAVELTPLPRGPRIVLGVFELRGEIMPVLDIRHRFGLRSLPIDPDQQMIVARAAGRRVALLVDRTLGPSEVPREDVTPGRRILDDLPYLKGIARTSDGLVLIHDLDTFLALDEASALDAAVAGALQPR